jgi:hypothetical protein
MVVHTCNPSTQEDEAGESQIQGQAGLHSKFKANLGYVARLSQKRKSNPQIHGKPYENSKFVLYTNKKLVPKIHM